MNIRLNRLGRLLLVFVGINLIISTALISLNKEIFGEIIFISLLLSIIILFLKNPDTLKQKISTAILFIIIVFGSISLSGLFYDFSYDGQYYHQEAIISIKEGWNPLYDNELSTEVNSGNFWINHYPKATWFLGAILYDLTDKIEYAKGFNFIVLISALLITFRFVKTKINNLFYVVVVSIITVLNPIVISQIYTTYNDFLVGLLITILLFEYLSYFNEERSLLSYLTIFSSIILLTNTKFTALGYAVLISCLPIALIIMYAKKNKEKYKENLKLIIVIIMSFLISVLFVGASSYVKNFVNYGHPFYPLAGENSVDIITINSPPGILELNRIEKLYVGIFSETSNSITEEPKSKFPIKVTSEEIMHLTVNDTRIGGFGPLYGFILIMLTILIIKDSAILFNKKNIVYIFTIVILLISVLINPETWWARYIPQFWLIPIISILYLYKNNSRNWIISVILCIFVINSAISAYSTFDTLSYRQNEFDNVLEQIQKHQIEKPVNVNLAEFKSIRAILEEKNINYNDVSDLSGCNVILQVSSSTATFCGD